MQKNSGLLGRLGIGVSKDEKLTMKVEIVNEHNTASDKELEISMDMKLDPGRVFEVYYDTVFGMVAFREYAPGLSARIMTGSVVGSDGRPVANEAVSVTVGGVEHVTATNPEGKFKVLGIKPRRGALRIGAAADARILLDLKPDSP